MKVWKWGWRRIKEVIFGLIVVAVWIGFAFVLLLVGYYVVEFLYPGRLAAVGLGDRERYVGGQYLISSENRAECPRLRPMMSVKDNERMFVGHERGESSLSISFRSGQWTGQVNEDGTFAVITEDGGIQGRFAGDSLIGAGTGMEYGCSTIFELRGKRVTD